MGTSTVIFEVDCAMFNGIEFGNNYRETAYLTFIYPQSSCSGNWRKVGWYEIPQGGTVQVATGNTNEFPDGASFLWFATLEGLDPTNSPPCWTGTLNYGVPDTGFSQCLDDPANCNLFPAFNWFPLSNAYQGAQILLLEPTPAGKQSPIGSSYAWIASTQICSSPYEEGFL
jgi:hypothetical protein